jgi:hypothetical protein
MTAFGIAALAKAAIINLLRSVTNPTLIQAGGKTALFSGFYRLTIPFGGQKRGRKANTARPSANLPQWNT